MVDISQQGKIIIDSCVQNDEGGWKLTSNVNDPDGGWTYAGVTKNTFSTYNMKWADYNYAAMCDIPSGQDKLILNNAVYDIYNQKFIAPLQLPLWPQECWPAMFSCAINRGPENAIKAAQEAIGFAIPDGVIGKQTKMVSSQLKLNNFLREWMRQYILLVRDNARAWRDVHGEFQKPPTAFRVDSLEGWFNRVERYRV